MASIASSHLLVTDPLPQPLARNSPWVVETDHANDPEQRLNGNANGHTRSSDASSSSSPSPTPDPRRSPSVIALYAHLLGLVLGISTSLTILLSCHGSPLWRLPAFLAALSIFHWLEFYTTASYNPAAATVSAFLLQNGRAYNIAHSLAFLECFIHYQFYPDWSICPIGWRPWWLGLGFALLVIGQGVRTTAMIHAGSNFNHLVQSKKKLGHELVTDGIYAWLRHPSYFGFFWWGLGTQIVLGNIICLQGYAAILSSFFKARIESEWFPFFEFGYIVKYGLIFQRKKISWKNSLAWTIRVIENGRESGYHLCPRQCLRIRLRSNQHVVQRSPRLDSSYHQ